MRSIIALFAVAAARMPAERVVYAINCGSDAPLSSADGFVFAADKGFSSNSHSSLWQIADLKIKYSSDSALYATERWAAKGFVYALPVPSDGAFVIVTLHAENAFSHPRARVWNHFIGARRVEAELDAVAARGPRAAFTRYYPVIVRDGEVYFNGELCAEGFAEGAILFGLADGGKDNPMINGIIVLRGTLADTPYAREAELRAEEDRRYADEALRRALARRLRGLSPPPPRPIPPRAAPAVPDFANPIVVDPPRPRSFKKLWAFGGSAALLLAASLYNRRSH